MFTFTFDGYLLKCVSTIHGIKQMKLENTLKDNTETRFYKYEMFVLYGNSTLILI